MAKHRPSKAVGFYSEWESKLIKTKTFFLIENRFRIRTLNILGRKSNHVLRAFLSWKDVGNVIGIKKHLKSVTVTVVIGILNKWMKG